MSRTQQAPARKRKTSTPGIYSRRNGDGAKAYIAYSRGRNKAFQTMDAARRWKTARDAAGDRGELDTSTATVHEYARQWIAEQRATSAIRPNTITEYERLLTNYALRFFSNRTKLAEVKPPDLARFVAWLGDVEIQGKALTRRSIKNALTPVSKMLRTAYQMGHVFQNPAAGVDVPNRHEVGPVEITETTRAFTRAQLRMVLEMAPDQYKLFFTTLAVTGMRVSEAVALRWGNVNTGPRPSVQVMEAYVRGQRDRPKSRNGVRQIPLPPGVAELLEVGRREDDKLVFASRNDTPLDADNVRRRVLKPIVEEAGAPWAGFHTFRHTYASLQINAGVPVVQLSKVLGHSAVSITLDVYSHVLGGEDAPALDMSVALAPRPQLVAA